MGYGIMGRLILIGVGVVFLGIIALAQVPNQFEGGNPISASRVNENFNYLANLVSGGGYTGMMICSSRKKQDSAQGGKSYFYGCMGTHDEDLSQIVFSTYYDTPQTDSNAVTFQDVVDKGYVMTHMTDNTFYFVKTK
jgi:hypothetical protein